MATIFKNGLGHLLSGFISLSIGMILGWFQSGNSRMEFFTGLFLGLSLPLILWGIIKVAVTLKNVKTN